jgi:hypothetical protein
VPESADNSLDPDVYKYVRMEDGSVLFGRCGVHARSHKQMAVDHGGTPISAGMIEVFPDGVGGYAPVPREVRARRPHGDFREDGDGLGGGPEERLV